MGHRSVKACAAIELAARLTAEQAWFLMELTSIDKEDSRFFSRNDLKKRTSLNKGLEARGQDVSGMVASLLGTYLGGSQRGPWRKTNDGNLVGHELELARDWLALHGLLDRITQRTPDAVATILAELARACEDHKKDQAKV